MTGAQARNAGPGKALNWGDRPTLRLSSIFFTVLLGSAIPVDESIVFTPSRLPESRILRSSVILLANS